MFERTTRRITIFLIFLTAVLVGVAFSRSQPVWGPFIGLLIAFGWVVGEIRNYEWASAIALILYSIAALFTVIPTQSAIWGVLIIVAALCAWNTAQFDRLIGTTKNIPEESGLKRQFFQRLLLVAAGGTLLAMMASVISLNISFGLALGLAVLAVIGLSQAFIFLRRESD